MIEKLMIAGVPRSLMTDGWWLSDAPPGRGEQPSDEHRGRPWRVWLLVGLVTLADVLLWQQRPGLSVALLAIAVMAAGLGLTGAAATGRGAALAGLLAALPVIEDLNLLTLSILLAGLLWCLGRMALPVTDHREGLMRRLALTMVWFSGAEAAAGVAASCQRAARSGGIVRLSLSWALPIVAGTFFLGLLSDGNPVLADILDHSLQFEWLTGRLVLRTLFWGWAAYWIWPFLVPARIGARIRRPTAPTPAEAAPRRLPLSQFVNAASVRNSLMLFNLLFAVQSLSDALFLWTGGHLPAGMSLAEYAHRGAYPLVLTALMAGLFALAARAQIQSSRGLVLLLALWLAQNLGLVVSSLYRLNLYVDAYGLTYLRSAAFIWMGLVGMGLILIFRQIAGHLPNEWLVRRLTLAAIATLYLCAFVNFADIIARQNLSRHEARPFQTLDCSYLYGLGEDAALAIVEHGITFERACGRLAGVDRPLITGWRDWGFRKWRLRRYLTATPAEARP